MSLKIEKGSRLLFMGDSVTDVGRTRPVSQGLFDPLGKGYPNIINGLLQAHYPERGIHTINMGNSGDNVLALKSRWQTDVFDLKPDWLSLMIGVNDVWRQFDQPTMPESHVPPDVYAATLEELIRTTKPVLRGGFVLMRPYYIETNEADAMRAMIDRYGEICRALAAKYDLIFVDTQKAFTDALQYHHSNFFSWDRVHPNIPGHSVLARAFLNAVGFEWQA